MRVLFKDVNVYLKCPEIRRHIRQMWAAKCLAVLTLIFLSPLILLGTSAVCLVTVFTYVGDYALWIPSHVMQWLHAYQRTQIDNSRAILSLTEIQSRTKNATE